MSGGVDLLKRILAVAGLGLAIVAFAILGLGMVAALAAVVALLLVVYAAVLLFGRIQRYFEVKPVRRENADPDPVASSRRHTEWSDGVKTIDVSADVEYMDDAPPPAVEGGRDEEMPHTRS